MKKELERELRKLHEKEYVFLNQKENTFIRSRIDPIKAKAEAKIPDKLRSALKSVFARSFRLLYEKGDGFIEKTYRKDQRVLEQELIDETIDRSLDHRFIKRMDKNAGRSKGVNTSFTIVEGSLLGFLGIGLPDIPLFIAVILKNIYEIALSYGFDYKKKEEKAYILLLISGALSRGSRQAEFNERIDYLGSRIDLVLDPAIDLPLLMEETSEVLAEAMLLAKFIQGIAVVGTIGGALNYTLIRKVGEYAGIKYKKRYLMMKALKFTRHTPE